LHLRANQNKEFPQKANPAFFKMEMSISEENISSRKNPKNRTTFSNQPGLFFGFPRKEAPRELPRIFPRSVLSVARILPW
jgi:hypothetical protein